jgi:putative oxidoreductase
MDNSNVRSWGLAVLRVTVGVVFLMHGSQKLFALGFHGVAGMFAHVGVPLPAVSAVVVTLVESLGGLALVLGVATRFFGTLLALDMAGAILFVHAKNGFFAPAGVELPLTLRAGSVCLLLAGPGALSLEGIFGRNA